MKFRFKPSHLSLLATWLALVSCVGAAEPGGEEFFERKVRPLLAERCYGCHSAKAEELKGGLRLDTRAGWTAGGHSGAVIKPGDVEGSLLIQAIRYKDKDLRMPPKNKPLSQGEVAILEQWVKMGAPDPRTDEVATVPIAGKDHWSFQPRQNSALPVVQDQNWPRTPVDQFILARLEQEKLKPAADADRRTLIRRATYDLIGLPPSPADIDAFLADQAPDAFDKVIERLLESPQYGERWGRHWMDLVRYADTAGDNSDFPIPQGYLYRNYIIDAFNADKPYDQFLREQIAGDLLPAKNDAQRTEQLVATGYLASARRFGSLIEQYPEHLTIEDTLDNLGRTVLGLTLSCARCHDHKFDPISARDYYGLYGILASTRYPFPGIELFQSQRDLVPLMAADKVAAALKPFRKESDQLNGKFDELLARGRRLALEVVEAESAASRASEAQRGELEQKLAKLKSELDSVDNQTRGAGKKLAEHVKKLPVLPSAYAVQDGRPADAAIQVKGEPNHPGAVVPRKFLDVLGGQTLSPDQAKSSGRLQLADWIVDAANPLTARVMVNRIWEKHFGRGLVTTMSDFGKRGQAPSHPALLDWLAGQFIAEKWSIKAMHRLMLKSHVYQLVATDEAKLIAADPDNHLQGRFTRTRLDAESMRDTLLLLAGTLDLTPQREPHPFPPMNKWEFTQHHPFKDVYASNKRSVYLMTKRLTAQPYFQTFDGADPNTTTPTRDSSVTAVQALYLLNDDMVHEQASKFAQRIVATSSDEGERLNQAFIRVLARPPTAHERQLAGQHLQTVRERLLAEGRPAADIALEAWGSLSRTLFQLNEFLYVD